MKEVKLGSDGT
jgi:hypothetical protein